MPDKRYRILIVHNSYRFAGGEDRVVQNEKKLLESHGHSVSLYEKNNTVLDEYSFFQKLLLPFRTLYSLTTSREITDIIRKDRIDIVHVHNTLPLVSFSVYYAAKKEGCTLIQTIHNFRLLCPNGLFYRDGHICQECLQNLTCSIRHSCYRDSWSQSALVAFSLWLHRRLGTFLLPDAYIALTDFNRTALTSFIPQNKLYLKPNFTENSAKFSSSKSRDYYLYASRLDSSKGIFTLLEAFLHLPGERLVIIGTGPEEESVVNYLAEHKMHHVEFRGFTKHPDVLSLLYHAKALLFPSQWYEGFPVIIAESLSLGTPVIGSNIGNTASIIEDGITGLLFQYNDPLDFAEKIRLFSSASFNFSVLEENCRKVYLEKYSAEANYRQLLRIYNKACGD